MKSAALCGWRLACLLISTCRPVPPASPCHKSPHPTYRCLRPWLPPHADVALPPVQALGPHVAPLGVLFWPASGTADWPAQYDGSVFVAEHGCVQSAGLQP